MSSQPVNPLNQSVPIVNPNGTPTWEFMRKWAQQFATNDSIPDLTTVTGDITIDAADVATLADSGVTAGVYGDAAHFPVVTVDAKGRVTRAEDLALPTNTLTLTDGTNTVTGVEQITVTGGVVGGATPNATLTVSGGGGGGTLQLPDQAFTSSGSSWPPNFFILTPIALRAGAVISAVGFWPSGSSGGAKWSVGVFDGSPAGPVNLLGNSAQNTGIVANVANEQALSVTIAADGVYWVGVWSDSSFNLYSQSRNQVFWSAAGGAWPSTAPGFSTNGNGAGIYAVVTLP